ncbi:hypothetical protein [Mucilaginibacter humi]|uniref:hypothetical protein n=1 Tax=Mucilaginibacter humi TaxID=2732510 RepID=UPI0021D01443|nr:hypothetical protein [Mucilaginibacter humi]
MVATDADCRMGTKWLSSIVGYYEVNDVVMISSPVNFFEEKVCSSACKRLSFPS